MAMRIIYRGIPIEADTIEELDELIDRYGTPDDRPASDSGIHATTNKMALKSSSPADKVLLKQLIERGARGVWTKEIGEILGKGGKSLPPAIASWAKRIGLQDGSVQPFEYCRVGSKRHVRIKGSVTEVAKHILEGRK